MEPKFKVGQRVIAVDYSDDTVKGDVGIVTSADDPIYDDWKIAVQLEKTGTIIVEHRAIFELLTRTPRFKQGDKVRAIDNDQDSGIVEGGLYTVKKGDCPEEDDFYIKVVEVYDAWEFNPHRALFVLVDE